MNQREIEKLLNKFNAGKCTDEELQLLQQLMHNLDMDAKTGDNVKALKQPLWERIEKQTIDKGKVRRLNTTWLKVAAAVLVAVCAGLFYSKLATHKNEQIAYQVITAPKGSMKQVMLPDSSTVQLNAGTSLKFPVSFGDTKREVTLINGEAFFDVKHDVKRPFMVHAAKVITQVLGTSFNIKFYKELPDIQVYVNSGKVEVHDQRHTLGFYTPRQQLTYNKQHESFTRQELTADHSLSWMHEELILDNASFKEITIYLQNRYNVNFKYNEKRLAQQHYSVRFSNKLNIRQVLDILQFIDGRKYKLNGDTVNIR
ncbi:FecR family protein [Mucilaginibacter sp. P25]|uniref:Ferric-dicitrate binding protein FerR, regulates iron transport through sigma-19 n=1 Tax=Mucilaginibacter gossypii TaxID=551996 RepID=A0A1G7ZHF0_9SPHI|nr:MULTISPECIES: FecR family protein [Mucilaginibacter]QTE37937.1 FecR domain-containing protein [Mucilaginibacter gossypii]SDH08153.1 ferric-dicitrate binding protein FerR, regulates iron transport through sigma-19 [Mucilaginibacter gossypii]